MYEDAKNLYMHADEASQQKKVSRLSEEGEQLRRQVALLWTLTGVLGVMVIVMGGLIWSRRSSK